ncbi:hypothetical protein MICAC_3330002 [Microcystis aeruginosa PCC 9443]|uniref:Uncharacterized protein n=1 Tax=Microcystis aeruginosa PCC 9443 TaxID=1160281 RepID=I4G3A8_MICAE|nr:hypothetical protein MICAC_3330002 [Microcystis aeruginosa PCC 9443]
MGIFANIPQLVPPERHRTLTHSFNKCAWCVPQKSISGAVGVTLGNAPYSYSDSDRGGGSRQVQRFVSHNLINFNQKIVFQMEIVSNNLPNLRFVDYMKKDAA